MDMLKDMGYLEGLALTQKGLYNNLTRYIKIAGSMGEALQPTCGMGQGCSLSLIAANATVAIELNMLIGRAPSVHKEAFIDDRCIDAETFARDPRRCRRGR